MEGLCDDVIAVERFVDEGVLGNRDDNFFSRTEIRQLLKDVDFILFSK